MTHYTKLWKRHTGIVRRWQQQLFEHTAKGKKLNLYYFQKQYQKSVELLRKQQKNQFGI